MVLLISGVLSNDIFSTPLHTLLSLLCGLKNADQVIKKFLLAGGKSSTWRQMECEPAPFFLIVGIKRLFSLRFFTGMDSIVAKCIECQRHPLSLQALNTLARQSWRPSELFSRERC